MMALNETVATAKVGLQIGYKQIIILQIQTKGAFLPGFWEV